MTAAQADLLRWVERNPDAELADWYLDGHCGGGGGGNLGWKNADRVVTAAERRGWIVVDGSHARLTGEGSAALEAALA